MISFVSLGAGLAAHPDTANGWFDSSARHAAVCRERPVMAESRRSSNLSVLVGYETKLLH
jgi:hypothetical protein